MISGIFGFWFGIIQSVLICIEYDFTRGHVQRYTEPVWHTSCRYGSISSISFDWILRMNDSIPLYHRISNFVFFSLLSEIQVNEHIGIAEVENRLHANESIHSGRTQSVRCEQQTLISIEQFVSTASSWWDRSNVCAQLHHRKLTCIPIMWCLSFVHLCTDEPNCNASENKIYITSRWL